MLSFVKVSESRKDPVAVNNAVKPFPGRAPLVNFSKSMDYAVKRSNTSEPSSEPSEELHIVRHTNLDEKGMVVDCVPKFLEIKESRDLYGEVSKFFFPFNNAKRQSKTFGDEGVVYEVKFREVSLYRATEPWPSSIFVLKTRVEAFLNEKYGINIRFNVCIVQRYPSGKFGIAPHKDKEMTLGTIICGISLGAERTLEISKYGRKTPLATIPLPSGSLYMLHPPTNSFCTHSIPKDTTYSPRISLTFRNYTA